jgi:hypothetical protein
MPNEKEIKNGIHEFTPDACVPEKSERPFQIVFIDFGMALILLAVLSFLWGMRKS